MSTRQVMEGEEIHSDCLYRWAAQHLHGYSTTADRQRLTQLLCHLLIQLAWCMTRWSLVMHQAAKSCEAGFIMEVWCLAQLKLTKLASGWTGLS